ncbi:hypothetical protein V6N13_101587 [Hibiscus sabdariffa]
MECRKFALLMVAMVVVLSIATNPTVTAARNGAMPFSIVANVDIRNAFADVFPAEKSTENCEPSSTISTPMLAALVMLVLCYVVLYPSF